MSVDSVDVLLGTGMPDTDEPLAPNRRALFMPETSAGRAGLGGFWTVLLANGATATVDLMVSPNLNPPETLDTASGTNPVPAGVGNLVAVSVGLRPSDVGNVTVASFTESLLLLAADVDTEVVDSFNPVDKGEVDMPEAVTVVFVVNPTETLLTFGFVIVSCAVVWETVTTGVFAFFSVTNKYKIYITSYKQVIYYADECQTFVQFTYMLFMSFFYFLHH